MSSFTDLAGAVGVALGAADNEGVIVLGAAGAPKISAVVRETENQKSKHQNFETQTAA